MFYLLIILIAIAIVALSVALLSVVVLLKKNGHSLSTHIEASEVMREKGIYCAKRQDREAMRSRGLSERLKEECE